MLFWCIIFRRDFFHVYPVCLFFQQQGLRKYQHTAVLYTSEIISFNAWVSLPNTKKKEEKKSIKHTLWKRARDINDSLFLFLFKKAFFMLYTIFSFFHIVGGVWSHYDISYIVKYALLRFVIPFFCACYFHPPTFIFN